MKMLRKKVVGLEGMLDATQGILNTVSGNAFSSARVLAGLLTEEDLPKIETLEVVHNGALGKVIGLEGMLDAIEGVPNNGSGSGFSIAERLAGLLTEEDLPGIVTLEVA
jgi:dihydroxyacetone kinase-like predicted kinase